MNSHVTLFVIQFIIVQVHSATIPVNLDENDGEGLHDSSSRLYLAEHPYFQNTIVGATMKKNLKKLCEQCKHSPLCRERDECEHCAKYCEAYGAETKGNMMASSMEEKVGIAREPENDFMLNEGEKDTTLVSRFADGEVTSNGMPAGMEREDRVRMVQEPMTEGMDEELVMDNHREHEGGREEILNHNHQESRYYTAGVIKPGLLMNILLKLINIKQTNDIEKAVILVKSKKLVPIAVGMGGEIETEFLQMLRKELETTEKIHGKSPLDSKEINKILETAYEKGEFKSRSDAQVVSESDSIPLIHKNTRFDDKIVSSPSEMKLNSKQFEAPSEMIEEMLEQVDSDRRSEALNSMQEGTNMKLRKDEQSDMNMMVSQSLPEEMRSSAVEAPNNSDVTRQNILTESEQDRERENAMDEDLDSDDSLGVNDKARTLHKHKYKLKKKKEKKEKKHQYGSSYGSSYGHSYGQSYGSNYNEPYGYYRSNDDQSFNLGAQQESLTSLNEDRIGAKDDWQRDPKGVIYKGEGGQLKDLEISQKTRNEEDFIGSQQQSLRPLNEDRIGAKDDWQKEQKGFIYKGEGGLLRDLEKSQKTRNNEDLIGVQQEGLRPLNEDRIGAKDGWQRDQKGFIYKGEGGLIKDLEKSHKTRNGDDLIGAQQEGLRPMNEDRIGAKDDWQRDRKGFVYKGEGGLLKDLENSQKTRNGGHLISTQPEHIGTLNEDVERNWQREQKGSIHEGQESLHLAKSQKTRKNEAPIDVHQESLNHEEYPMEDSHGNSERRANEGIAQIHLSEKNKMLDPKKVSIAEPYEDTHDGIPDPFHTRIHTHFKKIQEYFNKQSGTPTEKSESLVGMPESTNMQSISEDDTLPGVMMQTRNQKEESDSQTNTETDNLQMANNLEARKEMLSDHESPDVKEEPIDNIPKTGINFQPEDLINLQMAREETMQAEPMDDTPKLGINIQPQDMIILQKKMRNDNTNTGDLSINSVQNKIESPKAKAATTMNNIVVTGDVNDLENPINKPQFINGDENLPGQTVIQVDDQLIDVPDEGASIFQVNSQQVVDNDQEQGNMVMNQPVRGDNGDIEVAENVGAMRMEPSVNPEVIKDPSGQNLGLSAKTNYPVPQKIPIEPTYSFKKEKEFRAPKIVYTGNGDMERSSATGMPDVSEQAFPTPNTSPIKKHPFAPAFAGFRAAKIIQTGERGSERSSASEKIEESSSTEGMMKVVGDKGMELVGGEHMEYENAIEKKIEKLITPREQDFLHNFGKIVPSIEKMHLNSKSDIYFMGNGIKLPLKMSPNHDGSLSLSVDLEKLCKCKNSTCTHKMEIMNKLDGNLMDLSNKYEMSAVSPIGKHENDIHNIENHSEKKIRKPRNHIDLSKLYKSHRRKYHKLHRRSVSTEYFKRFKDIEQGLEKKLDDLNENVKKSNREYDNMLRKGTKDLLQIKEEDQVVKQRIELVNDLLKWMKEMASEANNVEDINKKNVELQ